MASNSERITGKYCVASTRWHDLHSCAATRQMELPAAASNSRPSLMQQAGLAVAQLALALAPHARVFWIACGPGNNGGDGFQAAQHLQNWGKAVLVYRAGTRIFRLLHRRPVRHRQLAPFQCIALPLD